MIDSKTKALMHQAIARHLAHRGPKEWAQVRGQFADVPDATFWRVVKAAKRTMAVDACQERIEAHASRSVRTEGAVAEPAHSQPHTDTERAFCVDLRAQFRSLFGDVEMLRAAALDGEGLVIDSNLLARSVALRERVLTGAIHTLESLLDLAHMEGFYAAILEAVGEVSADTQAAIIQRLGKIKDGRGYA